MFNRKADGSQGKLQKFVINFYYTTSSIVVNGSKVDQFVDDIFPVLCNEMRSHSVTLTTMNSDILAAMNRANENIVGPAAANSMCGNVVAKISAHKSAEINVESSNVDSCTSNTNNESVSEFVCPVCNNPAGDDTIECGECMDWFHFSCVGVNSKVSVNSIRMTSSAVVVIMMYCMV